MFAELVPKHLHEELKAACLKNFENGTWKFVMQAGDETENKLLAVACSEKYHKNGKLHALCMSEDIMKDCQP